MWLVAIVLEQFWIDNGNYFHMDNYTQQGLVTVMMANETGFFFW